MQSTANSTSKRGKTGSRPPGTSTSAYRVGPKPKPRPQIKPSQIHEIRVKTQKIQQQTKLARTQLNRLKDMIAVKTEAINRTVSKAPEKKESLTIHQNTIQQLDKSIRGATDTLEKLQIELENLQFDDRTAKYQEIQEELLVTYCEYDRLQVDIEHHKEEANAAEQRLIDADQKANPKNVNEIKADINNIKSINKSFRDKWNAYQIKIQKILIDQQIYKNRQENKDTDEVIQEEKKRFDQETKDLNQLIHKMNKEDRKYHRHVDMLMETIDNQRRAIVDFLMGKKKNEDGEQEEA